MCRSDIPDLRFEFHLLQLHMVLQVLEYISLSSYVEKTSTITSTNFQRSASCISKFFTVRILCTFLFNVVFFLDCIFFCQYYYYIRVWRIFTCMRSITYILVTRTVGPSFANVIYDTSFAIHFRIWTTSSIFSLIISRTTVANVIYATWGLKMADYIAIAIFLAFFE